jgi:lysozyme
MPYDMMFDISRWQGTPKLDQAKAAGFDAVIIKATQGVAIKDGSFAVNWAEAQKNRFMRGAYHFGESASGVAQAEHFLSTVAPDNQTLVAPDFERNPRGDSMSLQDAVEFVTHLYEKLNRWPILYGGRNLKQALGSQPNSQLAKCPLWLAQYGPTAELPPGWTTWTFWQFSDDNSDKPPAPVPGVSPCDRDRFIGSREELKGGWPF